MYKAYYSAVRTNKFITIKYILPLRVSTQSYKKNLKNLCHHGKKAVQNQKCMKLNSIQSIDEILHAFL